MPTSHPERLAEASFQDASGGVTLRRSNIKQLRDSVKGGCHLCNTLLEAITPSERDVAGLGGGSFEERSYQGQANPTMPGSTLSLIIECPGLSNMVSLLTESEKTYF